MIKLIKKHLKGYIFITILGPIFKLLEAIVELYLPLLVARIINVGIKELGDINYILKYGFLMFGLYIISFIFAVICQYFAAKSAYGFGTNLRNSLYEHINSLPLYQIDKFGTPTLITRINLDIVNTQNALNRFIRLVTRSPFILVGSLIMSLTINVRLSLIFFAAAILLSIALFLIMKVSTPWLRKINLSHDEVALLTRENYAGARVVRAFNKQDQEEKEFKTASDQLKKESIALGLISALSSPITYLIINTAIIFIVYFGGFEVSNNRLKDGDIIALINYLMQILNAMLVMAMLVNLFTKASVSSKRINEIFDTPVEEKQGKEVNLCSEYALIFDNVCMAYGKNLGYSLKDITFKLKKGNTLGIIGGTGSGKTTLISLIPKLYDYEGKIDFFGSDLKELSSISVRDNIAFVPQKSVLFSGTIKDNMLMANPNASEDDMLKALELAKCDFVKSISSVVLRGGSNFSGGQRQRLCIARALIKNAPLIILDDSMSALDYTTESQIKSNLNKLKDITKIIVTQRASSIKHADLIIVLDEGKAVGIGTHSELLKTCPVYKEINDIQGGAL